MLELLLNVKKKGTQAIKQWLGSTAIKAAAVDVYNKNPTVPKTTSFTVSGWVNITADQGVLFSLGTYYIINGNTYHSIIAFDSLTLGFATLYQFNRFQFRDFDTVPSSDFALNQWFHVAVEVKPEANGTFTVKVAKNGVFTYSRIVGAYHASSANSTIGGLVGVGDPNSNIMPGTGVVYDVVLEEGLVWKGVNFTPPVRRV